MSAGAVVRRSTSPRKQAGEDLPPFAVRRFTVEEYHRLITAGILQDGDPYELLDGWITRKMTHNPAHDVCVDLLTELFARLLPLGWRPRIQSAISLSVSEPEPDVTIVRGNARDFLHAHPGPNSIALVIEVADSSLDRDRLKAQLYAQAKISRYWLINLPERVIEDFSQPMGIGKKAKYKIVNRVDAFEELTLKLGRQEIRVSVKDVLP